MEVHPQIPDQKARHAMTDKNLTELLEQLHHELDCTQAVDEEGREMLRTLNADIQELLKRSKGGQTNDSVLERLQDTIDHFEATHPALTSTLSNIVSVLNNAGI
jgi:septal ring factor EnvC (AmiA/AmiB activator)